MADYRTVLDEGRWVCDTLDGHDLTWTGKEPKGKFNRMLSPEERRELLESVVYGETLDIAEDLGMNYMMIVFSRLNGELKALVMT